MRTVFIRQPSTPAKRIAQHLILICTLFLLVPATSSAGKLFKWVDESGVTHFSATPPPPQGLKKSQVTVENLSTSSSKEQRASSTRKIQGVWWARKDARVTRKLKLSHNDFELSDNVAGSYGVTKTTIASGRYKLNNGLLELTYFEHQDKPEKLDKTDQFEVTSLDDTKMTLLQDFTTKQVFKRKKRTESTDFSRKLKGEWQDLRNRKYKFTHGTFLTYREGNTGTREFGNWEWQDPELTLDFIADFMHPVDNNRGRMERWVIKELSYKELIFINQSSGNTQTLKRVR